MQRAALYVRVSTKKVSQKDSPEHQIGVCRAFCDDNGLDVVRVYEDRDSGTSIVGRPDVQRMVKDAQNREFDTIVFASLSRFSRDTLDSISLKRMLANALRKRVVSIEDLYDSEKDDNELLFNIVASVNQKLSEQISVSSRRGLKQSALKGNYTGSFAPYGYKKAVVGGRKSLVVEEDAAKVVRTIFDLYINHKMGEKQIVNYLNSPEVAIPSPRKKGPWGITTVQRILQNEAYTGRNVFSKYTNVIEYNDIENLQDRKKKMVQRQKDDWLRTEFLTHEPIIDDDTFQRAQEIRQIRGGGIRGGQKKYVNVFAKMIYCKHCGSAMVTMASKGQYRYLMCSRRRRMGETGCENGKWVPYYEMRDEIIRWISNGISERVDVETGTESVINQLKAQEKAAKNNEKEAKKYQRQIEQNRELLFMLRKQKMLGELDDAQYNYEKDMYEKEIAELEDKLEELQKEAAKISDYKVERANLKAAVEELKALGNYDDVDKVRITLSKLIKEITVDSEGNVDVYTLLGKLG
ncbi:recombinase family protein [Paenibacillus tarimensis]